LHSGRLSGSKNGWRNGLSVLGIFLFSSLIQHSWAFSRVGRLQITDTFEDKNDLPLEGTLLRIFESPFRIHNSFLDDFTTTSKVQDDVEIMSIFEDPDSLPLLNIAKVSSSEYRQNIMTKCLLLRVP
jgi:hypothetical protein